MKYVRIYNLNQLLNLLFGSVGSSDGLKPFLKFDSFKMVCDF